VASWPLFGQHGGLFAEVCMPTPPRLLRLLCVTALVVGCDPPGDATNPEQTPTETDPTVDTRIPLSDEAGLTRISMALRGVRPAIEDYEAVRAGTLTREDLVARWLDDPRFGETVRDLYAELLLLRAPSMQVPALGPLTGENKQDMAAALSEEPLALIEHVVTEGRPFTEIVTADYTVLDGRAARIWEGHAYDPTGPDVQIVPWTDGRPAAGILATNGLWTRHRSAGANHHRGRANLIADALLCNDFFDFNVPITADVDLSDPEAVADAVSTVPECMACHTDLDPLAAHLWTMAPQVEAGGVALSYLLGCNAPPLLNFCYPIQMYFPELAPGWLLFGLRPPAFYGQPASDLGEVGEAIAADPRFSLCTARRFAAYLTQRDAAAVPYQLAQELDRTFIDSGFDAKALAAAIVTHPDFLAADAEDPAVAAQVVEPQVIRPLQHGLLIEDLTGFRYKIEVDGLACTVLGLDCYGTVDVHHDDIWGFRSMTGGIDGDKVTRPTHSPTPTRLLFLAALAEEAAGSVVDHDLAVDEGDRHLLGPVTAETTDEATIRARLTWLHLRILGERVEPDGPEVDATWALFSSALADSTTRRAWKVTLAAMLQAPQVLFY
jgi:hypothetical protein